MTDEKLTTASEEMNAAAAAPAETSADPAEKDESLVFFTGGSSHSLDSKGRIIIPAQFRELLGERFFVAPTDDFKAIALYPTATWVAMRKRLAKLSSYEKLVRRYLTQFDALSYRDQECDNQGRLLLPARLRQRLLGDEKELEVSGAYDHVMIATRPKSEDDYLDVVENMEAIQDRLDVLNREHPEDD